MFKGCGFGIAAGNYRPEEVEAENITRESDVQPATQIPSNEYAIWEKFVPTWVHRNKMHRPLYST